MPSLRKPLTALAAAVALSLGAASEALAAQEVARLSESTYAHAEPDARARAVKQVDEVTRYTGSETVLPVIEHAIRDGREWLHVRLPGRPNGHTGWIPAAGVRLGTIEHHIVVDLSARRLTLLQGGSPVRSFRVVVGARRTPTPVGEFFVVERLRLHDGWARRGWALAISAYSEVFRRFGGGDGQAAIHAKGRLKAPLGSAASNGCIRMADRHAAYLARAVPDGTPVTVER